MLVAVGTTENRSYGNEGNPNNALAMQAGTREAGGQRRALRVLQCDEL